MLLSLENVAKSFGDKILYKNLSLTLREGEKVGFLGRNGTGKTTLFGIIDGRDKDFSGDIVRRKQLILAEARQHHEGLEAENVLKYITHDLPNFARLKRTIDTYPAIMGDNLAKMTAYSEAIEQFSSLGYYDIESEILRLFAAYQLDSGMLERSLGELSGGQKRLLELIKVQLSQADLVLLDEPTNHMDYVAKDKFLGWLKKTPEAALIISHDRDVLAAVDRIIELRDGQVFNFKGNYDDYLRINTSRITSELNEFETTQRRIENLKEAVIRYRRLKEKARDPGTIARFKSLQQKAEAELEELLKLEKPTFWIDRESGEKLNDKITASYNKHKARNIHIGVKDSDEGSGRRLIRVSDLSLGYDWPLLEGVSFDVIAGERVRLHGRNGAGKTTLSQALLSAIAGQPPKSRIYGGFIDAERQLKVGIYDQEVDPRLHDMTLAEAIEQALIDYGIKYSDQTVMQAMSEYLFNPLTDGRLLMSQLSGGQKARYQLIRMLLNQPQLLILDEPTNHLDLPSIEELELALGRYSGAIIYISHDSYFAAKLPAQTVAIGN